MYVNDDQAIELVLSRKDRFVFYLGAGMSIDAEIPTADQICNEIRRERRGLYLKEHGTGLEEIDKLLDDEGNWKKPNSKAAKEIEALLDERLRWGDQSLRYATCIKERYPSQHWRVEYFRDTVKDKSPSFCHHAAALLMRWAYFKTACVTTNFDKLIESAFTQQSELESQPIRTAAEAKFFDPTPDRYYVIKLHGDYDTYNILNTDEETIRLDPAVYRTVRQITESAGMLVIGAAGHEESVYDLFLKLTSEEAENDRVLSLGLLWGVYMGQPRPTGPISPDELERLIDKRIEGGATSARIRRLISMKYRQGAAFSFFPIWGSGAADFMYRLISSAPEDDLRSAAELYLDHRMRIRSILGRRPSLRPQAIENYIARMDASQKRIDAAKSTGGGTQGPDLAHEWKKKGDPLRYRVLYGDITSPAVFADKAFRKLRRAVVSAEDTRLLAGGGVALPLLNKAGRYTMLNELAKFGPPIRKTDVAVTSGGELPVHYVFHAAASELDRNGKPKATSGSVRQTMTTVLEKAAALGVKALWVPLLGSGSSRVKPRESLRAILEACADWDRADSQMTITIVVYPPGRPSRAAIKKIVEQVLQKGPRRGPNKRKSKRRTQGKGKRQK